MRELIIMDTRETPRIIFDPKKDSFEISGISIPENINKFYTEVLDWIRAYAAEPKEETVVDFNLTYYNTASSKMLLDILLAFDDITASGKKVKLNWYYQANDLNMKEAGEEYESLLQSDLQLIAYG